MKTEKPSSTPVAPTVTDGWAGYSSTSIKHQ